MLQVAVADLPRQAHHEEVPGAKELHGSASHSPHPPSSSALANLPLCDNWKAYTGAHQQCGAVFLPPSSMVSHYLATSIIPPCLHALKQCVGQTP